MRQAVTFLLLLGLRSLGEGQCSPPDAAVAGLKAYLAYENGLRANKPKLEDVSVLEIGTGVFFRLNNPPPDYTSGYCPVYVYDSSHRMRGSVITCPANSTWVNCVTEWVKNSQESNVVTRDKNTRNSEETPKKATCVLRVDIQQWMPSADDAKKKELAGEILQELRGFGYSDFKAVYIRDFNINDPDIWVYIITRADKAYFQGCSFDANEFPHCVGWHLFGQTPLDSLKREIMAMPYRLYPPPIGAP